MRLDSNMWHLLTVTLLLGLAVGVQSQTKKVCYPHLGCFDDSPPFNSTQFLPLSPKELDVKLKLYTPSNPAVPAYLSYSDVAAIKQSHFDTNLPVKVIIHGYFSSANGNWVTRMKDEILKKEQANVIDVDWSKGANSPNYMQVVANVRLVAVQIRLLLSMIADDLKVPVKNVHIIGHSLGAQMAGIIGNQMEVKFGAKIGRISALDAAELDYSGFPKEARIDASDALFVDAIHTDGGEMSTLGLNGGLGVWGPVGHVDFYVNGGKQQPGCKSLWDKISDWFGKRGMAQVVACNHVRSHQVYSDSINSECLYATRPCASYEAFLKGECADCGDKGCGVMGYGAQAAAGRGRQFLMTLGAKPYCGYQYQIKAHLESTEGIKSAEGELDINFGSNNGELTHGGVIKTTNAKVEGSTFQGVVIVSKKFDHIDAVVAHFKPKSSHVKVPFVITRLEVTALDTNKKQHSKPGSYSASGRISTTIMMEKKPSLDDGMHVFG